MQLKACTHRPILWGFEAESVVESAASLPESADSTTDFSIVGRLSISNMFDILKPLDLVGTGLNRLSMFKVLGVCKVHLSSPLGWVHRV